MEKIILENSNMQMTYDTARGGFVSVKSPLDDYFADFVITPEEFPQYDVENSKWLGTIDGVVAVDGQKQLLEHIFKKEAASYTIDENKIRAVNTENGLSLTQTFEMKEDMLEWTICLENSGAKDIEVLELNLPLLMDQYFRNDNDFKYEH